MQKNLIFLFLLNFYQCQTKHHHKCIHDEIAQKNPVEFLHSALNSTNQKRVLEEAQQFRITYDASSLDTSVTDNTLKLFILKLFQTAIGFFVKRVQIKYPLSENLKVGNTICVNDFPVPESDRYDGIGIANTDFHFYVTAEDVEQDWMAYASYCYFDQRPLAGRINFNLHHLGQDYSENWRQWIDTTIHEMLHAFGFDTSAYQHYLRASDNTKYGDDATEVLEIRQLQTTIFKGQLITKYLKDYFECNNIEGVQLENEGTIGSQGSHFERTLFYDELMTASNVGSVGAFSKLIFLMLEDSGWYKVDSRYSDELQFGYKEGCDFVNLGCYDDQGKVKQEQQYKEFCNINEQIECSRNYLAVGACQSESQFTDKCPIVYPASNLQCIDSSNQNKMINSEEYGLDSRCFNVKIQQSDYYQCQKSSCQADNTLIIQRGSKQYHCTSSGQEIIINDDKDFIICPNLHKFCQQGRKFCGDNWCSQNGHCTGGVCTCIPGYAGLDCSQKCDEQQYYNSSSGSCESECPNGKFKNEMNQSCHPCHVNCLTCFDLFQDSCQSCNNKLLQETKCVDSCDIKFYQDSSTSCAPCDSNCLTCQDSSTHCLSCNNNQYLDTDTNTCLQTCNNLTAKTQKICVDTCPDSTYQDGNVCVDCDSKCYQCQNKETCQKCRSIFYLYQEQCYLQCPQGYYANRIDRICWKCHDRCINCKGLGEDNCVSCLEEYVKVKQISGIRCEEECPTGYYEMGKECVNCGVGCLDCRSESTCRKCEQEYFMYNEECLRECPDGSFIDTENWVCLKCNKECKNCFGQTNRQCTSCPPNAFLYSNQCFESCPKGTLQSNTLQECLFSHLINYIPIIVIIIILIIQ